MARIVTDRRKPGALDIGDTSRDGMVQCVDLNPSTATRYAMRVTVREMIGGGYSAWVGGRSVVLARMRRLARKAAPRGAEDVRTTIRSEFYAGDSGHVTFVVTWR